MATRERPAHRGRRLTRFAVRRVAADLRLARTGAGISQRFAAEMAGVSRSQFGRLERGETAAPSTDVLGACCAVVGLELAIRAYPAGDPVRDRAHAALLERLRSQLHPTLTWRTEVPLPLELDLRAWDAQVGGLDWRLRVEAEMRIDDGQALERRLALKMRDGGEGHVVLLIADTKGNRAAMAAVRPHLQEMLPLDARSILAALRAGRDPGGSGIVML